MCWHLLEEEFLVGSTWRRCEEGEEVCESFRKLSAGFGPALSLENFPHYRQVRGG